MTSGATTAKVRARGLDGTGVTEAVAKALFTEVGSGKARVAIVELEPVRQINEATGDHKVECTLGFVEVAEPGSKAEDALRELSRALYRDRRGEVLPGMEDTVAATDDAAAGAQALVERGEDGEPEGTWTGDVDDAGPAGPGADDASFDPDAGVAHKFMPGSNDATKCAVAGCGKTERAKVHASDG